MISMIRRRGERIGKRGLCRGKSTGKGNRGEEKAEHGIFPCRLNQID
jgi:hypothetical protein